MKPQPRKEGVTFTSSKKTPAAAYVDSLDGEFYRLSEVAEKVGISAQTLRRLIKRDNPPVKAPSFEGHLGDMPIYLFSKEDLEEIREYYNSQYEGFDSVEGRKPGRPKKKKAVS